MFPLISFPIIGKDYSCNLDITHVHTHARTHTCTHTHMVGRTTRCMMSSCGMQSHVFKELEKSVIIIILLIQLAKVKALIKDTVCHLQEFITIIG